MNLILSLDEETVARARRSAEAFGKSLVQQVHEYLERLSGKTYALADAAEFRRVSLEARGRSRSWKFNRDEIHQR
jgi:hypothetical protein